MAQNQGDHGPNAENQRRQQPSQGQFPPQPTHTQGGKISQPQVCLANGEAVDQPGVDDPGQQKSVPQPGVPPQQRLEHIVPDPDPQSQDAAQQEPFRGDGRGRHPSSRRSQPPAWRSSW